MRFSLSQRKDVTALEPEDHSELCSAPSRAKVKGAGKSRTWELDHPGFRVKVLVLPH